MNESKSLTLTTRRIQTGLTILGLTGIVWPFFPFIYDIAPMPDVWSDSFVVEFWPIIVFCIVLPVPISAGYILWLKTGRLPRWWALISYVLAAAIALSCLVFWATNEVEVSVWHALPFAGSAWLLLQGVDRNSTPGGLLAMQAVYTVPITFWLVIALISPEPDEFDNFQIGAWLGTATLIAYLGQILLALKRYWWSLALLAPLAVLAVFVFVEA